MVPPVTPVSSFPDSLPPVYLITLVGLHAMQNRQDRATPIVTPCLQGFFPVTDLTGFPDLDDFPTCLLLVPSPMCITVPAFLPQPHAFSQYTKKNYTPDSPTPTDPLTVLPAPYYCAYFPTTTAVPTLLPQQACALQPPPHIVPPSACCL